VGAPLRPLLSLPPLSSPVSFIYTSSLLSSAMFMGRGMSLDMGKGRSGGGGERRDALMSWHINVGSIFGGTPNPTIWLPFSEERMPGRALIPN